jgi:thiol-disulfide isomerase/thioredoxin
MRNRLIVAFGILLIAILVLRIYARASREGFQSGGNELVIIKADWCGHCKRALPEFEKLVASSPMKLKDGSSVTIRMLDEKANKSEVEPLNVRGFPTILLFKDGTRLEYEGERTYNGVMSFLESA